MTMAHACHGVKSASANANPKKNLQSLAECTVQKATEAAATAAAAEVESTHVADIGLVDDDHDHDDGGDQQSPMSELLEADGGGDLAVASLDYEHGGDSPVRDGRGRGRAACRGRGRGRAARGRGRAPSAASAKSAAVKSAAKRQRCRK